jgi:hypothetical protein
MSISKFICLKHRTIKKIKYRSCEKFYFKIWMIKRVMKIMNCLEIVSIKILNKINNIKNRFSNRVS